MEEENQSPKSESSKKQSLLAESNVKPEDHQVKERKKIKKDPEYLKTLEELKKQFELNLNRIEKQ